MVDKERLLTPDEMGIAINEGKHAKVVGIPVLSEVLTKIEQSIAEAQDTKTRAETLKEMAPLLEKAKALIKTWHSMGASGNEASAMWVLYQKSPEMKRLNSAIEALKRGELPKE